ncbi:hypothetical protein VTL71DRAFT_7524 [Oculimacula yallundae]|uniref:Uncharacterized protein n=1 Tax=Oculimacula yallundae TaxID=86028 RepID=A0ABR4BVJ2_9HELO
MQIRIQMWVSTDYRVGSLTHSSLIYHTVLEVNHQSTTTVATLCTSQLFECQTLNSKPRLKPEINPKLESDTPPENTKQKNKQKRSGRWYLHIQRKLAKIQVFKSQDLYKESQPGNSRDEKRQKKRHADARSCISSFHRM